MISRFAAVFAALCVAMPSLVRSAEVEDLKSAIHTIRQVGPEAKGSAEAAVAWMVLATAPVEQLPLLLAGMDGATPLARNWIRAAVDEVMEVADRGKKPLPSLALENFLADSKHDPQARQIGRAH